MTSPLLFNLFRRACYSIKQFSWFGFLNIAQVLKKDQVTEVSFEPCGLKNKFTSKSVLVVLIMLFVLNL